MLGANSMMPTGADSATDALNANMDLETQSQILQSDALALKVIEKLGLASTADFRPENESQSARLCARFCDTERPFR